MMLPRVARRSLLLCALIALIATPAFADLTLVQTVTTKAFGPGGGTSTSTTYIKGLKMRIDSGSGDAVRTMIFDIDGQKVYIFDAKKKEAEVFNMSDFGKTAGTAVQSSDIKASLAPTGQTKAIAGKVATGYQMNISMPMQMGDAKSGMQMTVNLTGPIWVVKNAPGTADFLAFYKAAADRGWILSDPSAAKRAGGQSRAMVEMYRQFASTGGVPYETEMSIKMDMGGGDANANNPMAGMMARMGGITSTSTVQSVSTGSLSDALFAPPTGYTLKTK